MKTANNDVVANSIVFVYFYVSVNYIPITVFDFFENSIFEHNTFWRQQCVGVSRTTVAIMISDLQVVSGALRLVTLLEYFVIVSNRLSGDQSATIYFDANNKTSTWEMVKMNGSRSCKMRIIRRIRKAIQVISPQVNLASLIFHHGKYWQWVPETKMTVESSVFFLIFVDNNGVLNSYRER